MRRDVEVLRALLFEIESADGDYMLMQTTLPYEERVLEYHFSQLEQMGLLSGAGSMMSEGEFCDGLTPDGHDLIDQIREDTRWNRLKSTAIEAGKVVGVPWLLSLIGK